MALLKTYNVSNLCIECLHHEIEVSGYISNFGGIQVTGDSVDVFGDSMLDETALDAVVAAHDGESLESMKIKKLSEIDLKTTSLINQGFVFDSQTFSLSAAAQGNWLGMKVLENSLTWPVNCATIDGFEYSLQQVDLDTFIGVGQVTLQTHLASGRALKVQVNNATTKAGVQAVVDNR